MESARQEFEAATRPQERSCTRERSETRPQGRAQDVRGSIRSHPRPWHLIFVEYDPHIEAGAEDARAGAAGAPEGRGFELVGRSPRLRGGRPEAKHRFAKRERADTDVGPGGCKGIIIAAGRQRQQCIEVAGATLQMARVLFASNEAPRPREKRIFAFTTSCRADSVPRPYISLQDVPVEKQAWQR